MSYSPDARKMAIHAYKNSGRSIETTAKHLGIAKATLQEWLERDKRGESLEDRPKSGHPRRLNPQQVEYLIELTQEHPDWIQQRFADEMNQKFSDLHITQAGISDELKRAGISLKKTVAR